jgi:hypothetical protein
LHLSWLMPPSTAWRVKRIISGGASLPAGRHTGNPASRSSERHAASAAGNRRQSAHANTAQPANQGQHRMRQARPVFQHWSGHLHVE